MKYSLRAFLAQACLIAMGLSASLDAVDGTVDTRVASKKLAEWTIAAYIQADNNLAPDAVNNINDMQLALLPDSVNMLVEWDQPDNDKTWRYRITHGGRIEDASLSTEMGLNPTQEIIDMMRWAKSKYEAKHYCTILWNHGAGVIDSRLKTINAIVPKTSLSWLEVPGLDMPKPTEKDPRGILYDDSQHTYATNKDLSDAFAQIKKDLGKSVDIVGMDACLMAMIEIGYQIKDSANVLVASQHTEPGSGWAYSGFLKTLCLNPATCGVFDFASAIVNAYGAHYKRGSRDYTQSAIDLSRLDAVKNNLSQVITAINACNKIDGARTKQAVYAARRASIEFSVVDYIDLHSFYAALADLTKKRDDAAEERSFGALLNNLGGSSVTGKPSQKYLQAVSALNDVIAEGMHLITDAVIANAVGAQFLNAKGISIYYPKGLIHISYKNTFFAQDTDWISFIRKYR